MCVFVGGCPSGIGLAFFSYLHAQLWSIACVTFLLPTSSLAASSYTILVNNNEIHNSNGLLAVGGLTSITVTCRLDRVDPRARIILERITTGQTLTLNSYTTSYTDLYTLWTYTLNDADKQTPVSTYRCRDSGNVNCPDYVQVTLYSTTQRPPPGATIPNCPPGGSSNPPPSSDPTTRRELGAVVVIRLVTIMFEFLPITCILF